MGRWNYKRKENRKGLKQSHFFVVVVVFYHHSQITGLRNHSNVLYMVTHKTSMYKNASRLWEPIMRMQISREESSYAAKLMLKISCAGCAGGAGRGLTGRLLVSKVDMLRRVVGLESRTFFFTTLSSLLFGGT